MVAGILPELEIEYVNRYPQNRTLVPTWWDERPSYYGATEEHKAILQDLYQRCAERAFILEDDAMLLETFFTQADAFYHEVASARPNWQGMFLGGRDINGKDHVSGQVWRNKGCLGSHAYVVSRPGIQSLYDQVCRGDQVIDWAYKTVMEHIPEFYSPSSYYVGTAEGWSDGSGCHAQKS